MIGEFAQPIQLSPDARKRAAESGGIADATKCGDPTTGNRFERLDMAAGVSQVMWSMHDVDCRCLRCISSELLENPRPFVSVDLVCP